MKRVFYPDRAHSWLQLPVTLKGLDTKINPHLTIKFFGATEIDVYAVERRASPVLHETMNEALAEFVWEPKLWSSPGMYTNHYVLAFTKYPTMLAIQHKMFDLIKDQYIPWTPHITVTKEYFLLVEDQGFTPAECKLEFGEAELCLGGPNL